MDVIVKTSVQVVSYNLVISTQYTYMSRNHYNLIVIDCVQIVLGFQINLKHIFEYLIKLAEENILTI